MAIAFGPDEAMYIGMAQGDRILRVAPEICIADFDGDHLIGFSDLLILLAGTFKRILITITGFTIAHSVTLAMAEPAAPGG